MALTRRMLMSLVACSMATAASALGQVARSDSAVFRGRAVRAVDALAIGGVEVSFPSLDRHTVTDSTGAFRFTGLPVGLHAIQLRRVGFWIRRDTVTIEAGDNAPRVYVLDQQTPTLDTVHSIAGKQRYISPNLRAFEDRRLSHAGGYFVSDSVFRRNENTTMANILQSRMPGISWGYFSGHKVLVSARKACRGLAFHSCSAKPDCFVAIYVDGTLYYNAKMADERIPFPDMEKDFNPANFAGAEYYAGGASSPIGMHSDDDGCGSLWLWTRER